MIMIRAAGHPPSVNVWDDHFPDPRAAEPIPRPHGNSVEDRNGQEEFGLGMAGQGHGSKGHDSCRIAAAMGSSGLGMGGGKGRRREQAQISADRDGEEFECFFCRADPIFQLTDSQFVCYNAISFGWVRRCRNSPVGNWPVAIAEGRWAWTRNSVKSAVYGQFANANWPMF